MLIKESSYAECLPLLKELWPDKEPIPPIDNTLGMIKFWGSDYSLMKPRYVIAIDNNGEAFGCTHAYLTGPGELRVRGTYCKADNRYSGVASTMVNQVIDMFPDCNFVYTFPRNGVEGFYASLGFTISEHRWPGIYKGVSYAWKHLNKEST